MKLTIITLLIISTLSLLKAQHQHTAACGTSISDQDLIIKRLLDNRKNIKPADITAMQSSRAVTYVPLSIHNIADANGNGYTPIDDIYTMVCDLNNNYADQDIQFFIYDSVLYHPDFHIHDNHWSISSNIKMSGTYKVYNTVNVYITSGVNATKATSFYSPSGDYVVMYKPQLYLQGASITPTHELGHFFTLPHTFVGWENTNAEGLYGGGNVPTSVNGKPVEYVARTGTNANCSTAADKFCDTPADYYSATGTTFNGCNVNPTAKDPSGASLDPEEHNYMSYYSRSCRNMFSTEQKGAIAADILARSNQFNNNYPNWTQWVSQTPTSTTKVSEVGLTHLYPADASTIAVPASGTGTTTFDWSAVAGATFYNVELYPATPTGVYSASGPIWTGVVKNGDAVNIPNTNFTDQFIGFNWTRFAWKVRPMNDYWTCANYTSYTYFDVSPATGIEELAQEKSTVLDVELTPNPVSSNEVMVNIISTETIEGTIELYTIQGQRLATNPNQLLTQGENKITINLNEVNAGVYMVVVQTSKNTVNKKLIVQK